MNWPALVERLARALKVWWSGDGVVGKDEVAAAGGVLLMRATGHSRFHVWTDSGHRHISTGQALFLLLEVARGQRLDVGPCPRCEGRRFEYKPTQWPTPDFEVGLEGWRIVPVFRHGKRGNGMVQHLMWRPCPECSEPGPPVECEACVGNGSRGRITGRACVPCRGHGRVPGPPQPTGRDVREPWEWVLDATARPPGPDDHTVAWKVSDLERGVMSKGFVPGDPTVRAAASWLARSTTEWGSTVLGDWRETYPDKGPDECPLPPDSAWGRIIAAGLRGECQGCQGGWVHEWTRATPGGWDPTPPGHPDPVLPWTGIARERWSAVNGRACRKVKCPDCRGLGEVLGAPSIALEALVVAECEAREQHEPAHQHTSDRSDAHAHG